MADPNSAKIKIFAAITELSAALPIHTAISVSQDINRICRDLGVTQDLDSEGTDGINYKEDQAHVDKDVQGCRACLLAIVVRAAADYKLYKDSERADKRAWAESAARWLFEEDEGHEDYRARTDTEKLTSFVSICSIFEVSVHQFRDAIAQMEAKDFVGSGRPPQYRKTLTKKEKEKEVQASDYFTVREIYNKLDDLFNIT